jgi:PilZ domain
MIETPRKPAVHDQVRVEAEIGGRLVGFRAVVVNTLPAALWLGLVKPDPLLERLAAGEPIALTFPRPDGGLVAESIFLGHLGSSQARIFSVQMPSDIRLTQRRAHLRFDTACPIEYTIVSQSDSGGAGLTGAGVTCNIGTGGLQFTLPAPLREAPIVFDSLEIMLAVGREGVAAEGDVVRVEDATDLGPDGRMRPSATPPRPPRTRIAVQFTSISDAAQDLIVRHIFALQRARR